MALHSYSIRARAGPGAVHIELLFKQSVRMLPQQHGAPIIRFNECSDGVEAATIPMAISVSTPAIMRGLSVASLGPFLLVAHEKVGIAADAKVPNTRILSQPGQHGGPQLDSLRHALDEANE